MSDEDFFVPDVPPPKGKPPIPKDLSNYSEELIERLNDIDSEETQAILLFCERCEENIIVPLDKESVLKILCDTHQFKKDRVEPILRKYSNIENMMKQKTLF